MANNKVQLADGTVLMDVTDTTALASTVKSGDIFYNAAGIRQTGTLIVDETYSIQQNLTNVTSSVDDTKVIAGNCFYTKLTPSEGYNILSVIVTMDGVDITEQVFKPGVGEKVITANGTYDASEDDFSGYDSVIVNVPNSYSSSDEGKVVSNGVLVAQTSDTVTQNGTVDTTLINSLIVNVSGGSSSELVSIKNMNGLSSTWALPELKNTLSSGGYFEFEFYDPTPLNDYGNILGFGLRSGLSGWSNNTVVNFFHYYTAGTTDRIVVRQNSASNYYEIDSSISHRVKIDKDYIYVDGNKIVATSANVVSQQSVSFGSMQGSKRYIGVYNYIKIV